MRALIVEDGEARGALTAVRGLASAGWTVGVGSPRRGLAARSRSTAAWHRIPSVGDDLGDFMRATRSVIEKGGYDIVFGGGDAEVLALSAGRTWLPAVVPHSPHASVMRAFDKIALSEAAHRAGIPTPSTLAEESVPTWSGPVVVKERVHAPLAAVGAPTRLDAQIVSGPGEARGRADEIRRHGGQPLFQEVLRGRLMAHVVLTDEDGFVVAELAQEADRTWPPGIGISSRARTVSAPPELSRSVRRLLRDLEWFGLAELQFLRLASGESVLIDFNGRFYGSLALSAAAGFNLAAAWAALATGRPFHRHLGETRVGVRYQWLEGDVRGALDASPRQALAQMVDCVRYGLRATHSIWSWRDPMPAIGHMGELARRAVRKGLRRLLSPWSTRP
jgi:predicted ATP-grasp superfamily ATP-dependent carboligase